MVSKSETKQVGAHPSAAESKRRLGHSDREGPLRPRIVLAIGGGVFAIVLAVAFYQSPMHFGLDRVLARVAFDAGVGYDKENAIDRAIERYDRAIALNPDLVEAYNNRGSDRRRKGDLDGAIADYGEVIRLRPDSEAGYYNRAVTWKMKGDAEAALSDFAAAIRQGRAKLQQLQQHRGGDKYARLTGILEAQGNLREAYLAHARLLVERGDYEQAIAGLDEAIAVAENSWPTEAHFERARIRFLQGQFAAVAAEFDRFAAYDGGYKSGALMYRGFLALFQANDPKTAAQDLAGSLQEGFQYRRFHGIIDSEAGGSWFSKGVPLLPNVHYVIVWQHVARERAGQDDRQELSENLKRLATALGYADLLGNASSESLAKSRTVWPGPIIDMFLGTRTPEAVRSAAEESADPIERRRRICDVDFYTGLLRLKTATAEARALLQRAASNCPPGTLAGMGARFELERVGS